MRLRPAFATLKCFTLVFWACLVSAQQPAPKEAIGAASIRRSVRCQTVGGDLKISSDLLVGDCITLRRLVAAAYSASPGANQEIQAIQVVGGPGWLDTERFDLATALDGNGSAVDRIGAKIREILEERFKLKVHKESRLISAYALTIDKRGPKLKPAAEGSCVPVDSGKTAPLSTSNVSTARFCGHGTNRRTPNGLLGTDWSYVTTAEFAERMLSRAVGQPVIDKTGLSGHYDIELEYVPGSPHQEITLNGMPLPEGTFRKPQIAGLTIFNALQTQLGLKLVSEKITRDVIVVDRVELPSGN